jgi:hypothetical protein
MRKILPVLILALAAAPAFAQEQAPGEYRGSEQDQNACIGDVFRLCGAHIPNVTNIVACLKEQKPNLSPACRVVFNNDRTQRTAQPRRATPTTEGSGGDWR